MRHVVLALIAGLLWAVPSAGQQSDARLARAIDSIDKNNAAGLRRLLQDDPSLVRRTEAGVLPQWRWTLLHNATAGTSSLEIIAALIDAGADVTVKDNEGNTPLHFAMKRINREKLSAQAYEGIIRLLLEKKADVRSVNVGGATPLHTAAAFRADPSGVEMLIQAGADVNQKTFAAYDAWTPLHGATARNSAGIVAVLLKYGADPNSRDGKGMTALQVAERGGFADAAKVLRASAVTAARPVTAPPSPVIATTPTAVSAPPTVVSPPAPPRPASTGGIVQGRVLWNGQPVAGATVYVADDLKPGSARYGTVTTDDQGRFLFSGIPEGNRYVGANGSPGVFPMNNGSSFTMTASPFTRDVFLCKGFDPASPANNESVAGRPVLRWDPYPDAARYFVGVSSQSTPTVFSRGGPRGDLMATSVQVDVDLPAGAYQWRVYAYNASGQIIGCSFGPRGFMIRR